MPKYQIVERKETAALQEALSREGQILLPLLEMIEQSEKALDEIVDDAGRATIQTLLNLSAARVAGPKHPGKKGSEIRWHGQQAGVVKLSERQIRVSRPRLRRKGEGRGAEVEVPAYEVMRSVGSRA